MYNELYQFDIEYHSFRRKLLEISRECALEELDAIKTRDYVHWWNYHRIHSSLSYQTHMTLRNIA
ncbi:IS3 family transposase [Streptococcus pyogenes]|uniref:Phage encoded transcriptional regulator, ArpU family n=1 Tax=Streptococcus pyogenes serotype M12 (strain MGAS9429) TaxID=370551 RepID=Q1JJT8_STRPC|nr:phage encoded transcriptional regulator, ArpU family [Streptococcus pyogenes MGAS9429]AYZ03510.1 hypothetical protein EGX78_08635 [Streptococcus pyogenes]MDV6872207.1 transposase [Pseudomonas aeruginosa]MYN50917.1 IS3 family transposase [Streptococcus pyogenes]MYN56277.1 IS3 family transposase [Streptococcus pyogenes]